jgi:hypothetical protein
MQKIIIGLTMGILVLSGGFVKAAELYAPTVEHRPAGPAVVATPVYPGCRYVWICGPYGCGWRHICRTRCPDRYSCYALYGAYSPYGGTPYWGAYTAAGWSYR